MLTMFICPPQRFFVLRKFCLFAILAGLTFRFPGGFLGYRHVEWHYAVHGGQSSRNFFRRHRIANGVVAKWMNLNLDAIGPICRHIELQASTLNCGFNVCHGLEP